MGRLSKALSLLVQQSFVLTAVSLAGNGQPVSPTRGCNANAVFRPGLSPYDIIQGKPPLKDLWATLGIPASLRTAYSGKFAAAPGGIDCTTGCEASIVTGDHLLTDDGDDSVVRVCTDFETTCRFLLLHQSSAGWSLVDYLDSPFEKYEPPRAWIEAAQDRRWLVKSDFGGAGTGVYLTVVDWFEIRCGSLQPVLTLPYRGHDVNAKPARYFSTRFKGLHRQGSRESFEFGFVVMFQDYDNEHQLWQEERTVVFSRTNTIAAYVFDPVASSMTASFKNKVFAFDSMDENDFVEFAYDRLSRIADDPADRRRDWLRSFLGGVPKTARVRALEALLARKKQTQPSQKQ